MENLKIAVLIDGDNASAKSIENTLGKIAQYGTITIKRVYGDWSRPSLNTWKDYSNKHSIRSVQAYSFVKGKNSTDSAMIIDAMDILNSKQVNAFCIVSSDCDFTGLVHRIKEDGLFTIGFGRNCACTSFKDACDVFLIEHKELKEEIPFNGSELNDGNIISDEELFKTEIMPLPGPKVVGKLDLNKVKY
jgi:uncharacterized protein (TIGR00288 family)